ncbi:MAG: RHS repeat-associated core domain-containing protein, partial [Geobacteraceae bacterium]|nr:RHS repeat-associated core domain-containing protein [Geobacteraceae bacterium]
MTVHEYDELERRTATTDALGRTTRFDYDAFGLLLSATDHAGRVTGYRYDNKGLLTQIEHPDGRKSTWEFDQRNNLVSTTDPDGSTYRYSYDDRGNPVAETGPDGAITRWEYDHGIRFSAQIDPLGNRTTMEEDAWGRLRSVTDAAGNTTRYEYDHSPENPRADMSRIIHPDGGEECFTYDREGLPVTHVAQDGQETRYSHSAFDLLRSITDPGGQVTSLQYDGAAQLTQITNALGQKWRYGYDTTGRLIMERDWAGRETYYARDAIGRVTSKRLPDGVEQDIAWDERDRITSVQTSRNRIDFEYDNADQLIRATTRALMLGKGEEPETEILLSYDERGRLAGEIQNGVAIEYRYDAAGRCINRTSPSGQTALSFDPRGLLAKYRSNGHELALQRNVLGLETERRSTGGNAFALLQGYDPCGRLKSQFAGRRRETPLAERLPGHLSPALDLAEQVSRRYQRDRSGRIITVKDSMRGLKGFRYDPRDQVTAIRRPVDLKGNESVERYEYDALMNLSHSNGGSHEYQTGVVTKAGTNRYSYDARGRTRTRTELRNGFRPRTWHYFWDDFDRLTDVHTPEGATWRYTYDAFGRRVKKECVQPDKSGRKSSFTYLWQGATLAEEWTTLADSAEVVQVSRWHLEPGTFNPLAKETLAMGSGAEKAGDTRFYPIVTDHLGTPKELFDESGACLWQAEHVLWGRVSAKRLKTRENSHLPIVDCTLRFQNQWEDEESGLYYNLHRYYDPDTGQYLSPDPIGLEGGLRSHGYVHDPMQWVDPLGLCKDEIAGLAPAKRNTGKTVLGHYPDYVKLSDKLNARRFQIPTTIWEKMSDAERWTANKKFLDRTIARNDDIILATPLEKVKPGSWYEKELQYLRSNGYSISNNGKRLVRK